MNEGRFKSRLRATLTSAAILLPILAAGTATLPINAGATGTRMISSTGTASFASSPSAPGISGIQSPEIRAANGDGANGAGGPNIVNRSASAAGLGSVSANGSGNPAKSNPVLNLSFDGLNHRDQRLANGGNQYSVEPPDQGLCAGNGFVLESVNDVMKVFDYSGKTLKATTDLNTFYGYPPAIVRSPLTFGPFVTDPSCYYDTDTQRWFHLVLTLDVNPSTGAFVGTDHLDIAVSKTSDPTGLWTVYKVNAEDDGTNGQPNHNCSYGPCFGDYPHLGADANGFYVTTNEYSFFGPEFHGAQVYAFSKRALASGATSVAMTQFDTHAADNGLNGFTLAPAETPGADYKAGTEYFLSSNAGAEAHDPGTGISTNYGVSNQALVWSLTGTASLDSASPSLNLTLSVITVGQYATPTPADQKTGSTPLKDCLNNKKCADYLNGARDKYAPEQEYALDPSDTRMFQTTYTNGKLWGALDTALNGKAGIEYFVLDPSANTVVKNGYLGLTNNNLIYGTVGVTSSGRGVIAFTAVGPDHFPSAGYAGIDALSGVGAVQTATEGAGPADGFSGYNYYGGGSNRPRWGDYGAAAVVGNSIWIASEYIGQTCTLAQYEGAAFGGSGAFGSCGGTRTALANWDTRISLVTP